MDMNKFIKKHYHMICIILSIILVVLITLVAFVLSYLVFNIFKTKLEIAVLTLSAIIGIYITITSFIWRRRYYLLKFDNNDAYKVDMRLVNLFTNQKDALNAFDKLISNQQEGIKILSLVGVGGSGKSALINMYLYRTMVRKIPVALINGAVTKNRIEFLKIINDNLLVCGIRLVLFNERYEHYRLIESKVFEQSKSWESATKLMTGVAKELPFGKQASHLIDLVSEEFLTNLKSHFNKEDIDLYRDPERTLTNLLIQDIVLAAPKDKIIIFIDTYENLLLMDNWLSEFINCLKEYAYFVIAGQIPPEGEPWQKLAGEIKIIRITELGVNDSIKCLDNYLRIYKISNFSISEREKIVQFSGGLPLALGWSAQIISLYENVTFDDVKNEVVGNLIETMTRAAPDEMKKVIELLAIPRFLTKDIIKFLISEQEAKIDSQTLDSLPFVKKISGRWVLHDRVRNYLLEELKAYAFGYFVEINCKCSEFYEKYINRIKDSVGEDSNLYQMNMIELIYHTLLSNEAKGFEVLNNQISYGFATSKLSFVETLLSEFHSNEVIKQQQRLWFDYWHGEMKYRKGDWYSALAILNNLYDSAHENKTISISACLTIGRIYYQQGNLILAREKLEQCIVLLNETQDTVMLGYVTEQLAKVYRMEGKFQRALDLHESAINLTRTLKDSYQNSSSFGSYGTTLILSGRLEEGVKFLTESIEQSRRSGFLQFICTGLRSRAIGLMYLGKYKDAENSGNESLEIAEQLGDIYNRGFAKLSLGHVYVERGENIIAEKLFSEAIIDLEKVGAVFDLGNAYMAMARFQCKFDNCETSIFFDKSLDILSRTRFDYGLGWLYYYKGEALIASNNFVEAKINLNRSIELAKSLGSKYLYALSAVSLLSISLHDDSVLESGNGDLVCSLLIAEGSRFRDISAWYNFYMVAKSLEDNTDKDLIYLYAWNSLCNAIKYNCFLLDKIIVELSKLYERSSGRKSELCEIFNLIIDNWSIQQNGDLYIQIEKINRQIEMRNFMSNITSLLLPSGCISKGA